IWKIYDDRDEGGHGQRHIVHGHHQHTHGPILKKNRTNLDTFAWYTGRLVIAMFDDKTPGGPLEILEVQGPGHLTFADMSFRRNLNEDSRVSLLAMGDNTGNGAAKKFLLLDRFCLGNCLVSCWTLGL